MAVAMIKASSDVLEVLDHAEVQGNVLYLRSAQLDRKLYTDTNKVLEAMGGKWNRKQGGHVFESDPSELLCMVRETGEIIDIKKSYQAFYTPPERAAHLVELADIGPGIDVLEPSAGVGNIADELIKTECDLSVIEIRPDSQLTLQKKGYNLIGGDFLVYNERQFSRIVMNPPFTRQQDIDHVTHAWSLLKPGGRLVAIMSSSTVHRENRKAQQFRGLLDYGWYEENEDDAFKASGTTAKTITVVLDKPGDSA
jgi:hypothetical protein